MSIWRI